MVAADICTLNPTSPVCLEAHLVVHAVDPVLIQPLHKQHCMEGAPLEVGNHRAQGLQGSRGMGSGLKAHGCTHCNCMLAGGRAV